MPTNGFLSVTFMDYDSELSNVRFILPEWTALNFAAQLADVDTFMGAIAGLPAAMSMGTMHKYTYGNEILSSITPPNDAEAQRELKYLVSYHDTTSLARFSLEIPCADTDVLDPDDRKHANIGDAGDVDAWVAAFQDLCLTPDGGVPVVDEITLVGRRV